MQSQRKSSNSYVSKEQTHRTMPELREGDWICISCSNLNFSFRNICNRCKIQTKDSNFPHYYNFIITPPAFVQIVSSSVSGSQQTSSFLFEQNKQNKPFQSALLLTPTKNTLDNQDQEPYKSPCSLPSVSPLLKKYNSSQLFQCSTKIKLSSPLQDPLISKFHLCQDTFSPYKSEADQQINSQMSQLLSQIQIDI